jgi:hypothetical protein
MGSSDITGIVTRSSSSHAIVTAAELRAAGLDPRIAERQARRGRWQRPTRGVYVTHDRALSGADLARVARRVGGPASVVSGAVVLRELGLRWVPTTDQVVALVPPQVRTRSNGRVVLRRTQDVGSLQTWQRFGLPLAPVARAVVDAAREAPDLRDARGVVLGCVADRWADVPSLTEVLGTTQRNGSGFCRRALLDAERGCASPPEAELVDELIGCGVPFYVNPDVLLDGRLVGSPDIWLVGRGLGGEVDSVERHEQDDAAVASTYDRHERFAAHGLELVHLSVRRIRRDVAEAAGHLLARAQHLRPEPAGLTVRPRGPLLR